MKMLLCSRSGMSLMNVIILLMLVGVLTTAGVKMMGPLVQRGKINGTKTTINSAVDAIISWSVAKGRLPTAAEAGSVLPNPNDAWGRPLVYAYDDNLTKTETGGLCGRTTATTYNGQQTAFIIISGGDDYTINSNPSASQAFSGSPTIETTDLSKVVTLDDLKAKAGCFGRTGGRLRIVNNELPNACSGPPYSVMLYADGGVPDPPGLAGYTWSTTTPSWLFDLSVKGKLDRNPSPSASEPVTVTVTDSKGLSVQRTYTLNVTAFTVTPTVSGGNGSISPNAPLCVKANTTTSFTVTPNSGYTASVSGCGGTLSGNTYTTGPITANCTVTASFGLNTYIVTPSASAGGSISPNTPQNVVKNATTSFTVTPNSGYSISSVTGCGGTLSGNTYTTGPITADCSVTASFAVIPPGTPGSPGTPIVFNPPTPGVVADNWNGGRAQDQGTNNTDAPSGKFNMTVVDGTLTAISVQNGTTANCIWYQRPLTLTGKKLRAYFQFAYQKGTGFTFATVPAASGQTIISSCDENAQTGFGTGIPGNPILGAEFLVNDVNAGTGPGSTCVALNQEVCTATGIGVNNWATGTTVYYVRIELDATATPSPVYNIWMTSNATHKTALKDLSTAYGGSLTPITRTLTSANINGLGTFFIGFTTGQHGNDNINMTVADLKFELH